MRIDVALTYAEVAHFDLRKYSFIGVIDVLRATTTIVTALENEAGVVVPVATEEEARGLAESGGAKNVLLGGERHARMIDGFHLGNSPFEYTRKVVAGKTIALTTTNGTRAFAAVRSSLAETAADGEVAASRAGSDRDVERDLEPVIVAACVRNGAAVARMMVDVCRPQGGGALLVCAGTDGRFSWEDAYCAALIVERVRGVQAAEPGDGARAALALLHRTGDVCSENISTANIATANIATEIAGSMHGKRLIEMDLQADVEFCAEWGTSDVVPVMVGNKLVRGT